jgi:hypothetical protein
MGRPSVRWASSFAALGGVVAIVLFATLRYAAQQPGLSLYLSVHRAIAILWPSAIFLMATEGIEHTFQGWSIVGLSVSVNALLYGFVGLMLSALRPKSVARGDVTVRSAKGGI